MTDFFIEIEFDPTARGIFGIHRYNLNKKQRNLDNFSPGYFLNNDYVNGMNGQHYDFAEENLKIWNTDL
jgi:hypothetical protein